MDNCFFCLVCGNFVVFVLLVFEFFRVLFGSYLFFYLLFYLIRVGILFWVFCLFVNRRFFYMCGKVRLVCYFWVGFGEFFDVFLFECFCNTWWYRILFVFSYFYRRFLRLSEFWFLSLGVIFVCFGALFKWNYLVVFFYVGIFCLFFCLWVVFAWCLGSSSFFFVVVYVLVCKAVYWYVFITGV